jgi:hypothetical protein
MGLVVSILAHWAGAATGTEQFTGFLIATGLSGDRSVLATSLQASGVFNGHGRIVEVDSQPGDPDNVDRDDLVFAAGTMHLISTTLDDPEPNVDPRSCRLTLHLDQTGEIDGGTGRFAHATGSFVGTVDVTALLQRQPDGTCDLTRPPVIDHDDVAATGTLAF